MAHSLLIVIAGMVGLALRGPIGLLLGLLAGSALSYGLGALLRRVRRGKSADESLPMSAPPITQPQSIRAPYGAVAATESALLLFDSGMAQLESARLQAAAIAEESATDVDQVISEQFFLMVAGLLIGIERSWREPQRTQGRTEVLRLATGIVAKCPEADELCALLHQRIDNYSDIASSRVGAPASEQVGRQFAAVVNSQDMQTASHGSALFEQTLIWIDGRGRKAG